MTPEVDSTTSRVPALRLPDLRCVRILVVDDDPQAESLIAMALAEAPFERIIESVGTKAAGLARISADEHDVYLIDQKLPDGTGLDLIHQAKMAGASRPFILMTGYGSHALDEEASRSGAADYVEKNMVATQLERAIRYALRNWQAARLLHDREEQLRQAQKMEAIGRLAGGVAHDFNNLLTAIIGYTDLISERTDLDEQTVRDVAEIRKAADRAAALTRQLLAFSRKQFLAPTILDLNATASELLEMLPRVIGDHIQTTVKLGPSLQQVKADASQMQQVLMNLVLNARDAMPDGGTLTIETADVVLDDERIAAENLNLKPGQYVMLAVTDTGVGMDSATRERAFEPFFTTKPKGKGTGFGLATVYGIVDQSGGGIALQSAPGRGTSVRIYLPAATGTLARHQPVTGTISAGGGTESLLLVEDNDSVRGLAAKALRQRGYTVFEARTAEEALDWATRSRATIDLLVTDVVMPGLSGPNLAARLTQLHPRLRVLYMSGYTDDAAAVHGAFWGDIPLLQKPFTPSMLAARVRMALDAPAKPGARRA
ncbi:MAG TPA: response regulator [Vicinamibacterales bacterium]|nr:response regulator [Vicinamibacterales bacterium]